MALTTLAEGAQGEIFYYRYRSDLKNVCRGSSELGLGPSVVQDETPYAQYRKSTLTSLRTRKLPVASQQGRIMRGWWQGIGNSWNDMPSPMKLSPTCPTKWTTSGIEYQYVACADAVTALVNPGPASYGHTHQHDVDHHRAYAICCQCTACLLGCLH